jgi:hypothetical protein
MARHKKPSKRRSICFLIGGFDNFVAQHASAQTIIPASRSNRAVLHAVMFRVVVSEFSDRAGIPRTSVSDRVRSLVSSGVVEFDPTSNALSDIKAQAVASDRCQTPSAKLVYVSDMRC